MADLNVKNADITFIAT